MCKYLYSVFITLKFPSFSKKKKGGEGVVHDTTRPVKSPRPRGEDEPLGMMGGEEAAIRSLFSSEGEVPAHFHFRVLKT